MKSAQTAVSLVQGDIQGTKSDVRVNSCNEFLLPNLGEVCIAIHQAAGPDLKAAALQAGDAFFKMAGEVPMFMPLVTEGFNLGGKIIHIVAPRGNSLSDLTRTYLSVFHAAQGLGAKIVAVPLIGAGNGGAKPLVSAEAARAAHTLFLEQVTGTDVPVFALTIKNKTVHRDLAVAYGKALEAAPVREAVAA